MCLRSVALAKVSRIFYISLLRENPELRRILLSEERPDFALEDLRLSEWGREAPAEEKDEADAPAR